MGDEIACPEGKIDLIADMWDCKLTHSRRPIQACLHRDNWSAFDQHCEAPLERREAIKATVLSGAYAGFTTPRESGSVPCANRHGAVVATRCTTTATSCSNSPRSLTVTLVRFVDG